MWLWPLAPLLLLINLCNAAPTSLGPTSTEEARFLWKEGQAALQEARYQDALNVLSRFVHRYPGQPGHLKAHLLLGKTLLELGRPEEALAPLRDYISATGLNSDSARARLEIGRSYLALHQFQEAYLTTLEIDQTEKKTQLSSDILLEALLIKAQALLGLKHDSRAISALESAEKQISDSNSPEVKGQIYGLKLKLRIFRCMRLPGRGPLDEGQFRDQLERRGTCLLESLLLFQKILVAGDLRSAGLGVTQINDSFSSYRQTCTQSPNYVQQKGKKPSSTELKRFHAELTDRLIEDFKKKAQTALELLESWKPNLPPSMLSAFTQVFQHVKALSVKHP